MLPKKNYKVYYKNLEYYLKLGLKVTKIHRILTFDEKPFLKEYIDLNTELRKKSKNDLEKDLFKLMNNAIFRKSMENVLNRSNIKLINNNPEKLLKLIKPNFQNAYQISNRLAIVESKFAWSFPLKTKTVKEIKSCFQKIFKERKPSYIWSDQESAFFSKEMLNFLKMIT